MHSFNAARTADQWIRTRPPSRSPPVRADHGVNDLVAARPPRDWLMDSRNDSRGKKVPCSSDPWTKGPPRPRRREYARSAADPAHSAAMPRHHRSGSPVAVGFDNAPGAYYRPAQRKNHLGLADERPHPHGRF